MSDENRPKDPRGYEIPMLPIYGLDLGRELGALDSRLARVEYDIVELKRDLKSVDGRVDKCLVAINRLGERTRSLTAIGGGILIAVIAGLALQVLFR